MSCYQCRAQRLHEDYANTNNKTVTTNNFTKYTSCLYRSSTVSKHCYCSTIMATIIKITGILKQLKFRRSLWHVSVHVGIIIREPFLCLAKTTVMILYPRRSWRGQCRGSIPACCVGVRYTVYTQTCRREYHVCIWYAVNVQVLGFLIIWNSL
jgi:hypothetical protein